MSELTDGLNRFGLTLEDIRQTLQQAAAAQRSASPAGATSPAAGSSPGAGSSASGGPSKAALDAAAAAKKDLSEGITGKLGEQIGNSLSSGLSGLTSLGKNAISDGLGGGIGGAGAGAAFSLAMKGLADITQGGNAAIAATPLFANQNFTNTSEAFGRERGFNNFFGQTLGLNGVTSFFTEDNRRIDERQQHEQSPILRAAGSLADTARMIAEQGGEVDMDAFRQIAPFEVARQRRGQDASEAVFDMVTAYGALNPSNGRQYTHR